MEPCVVRLMKKMLWKHLGLQNTLFVAKFLEMSLNFKSAKMLLFE